MTSMPLRYIALTSVCVLLLAACTGSNANKDAAENGSAETQEVTQNKAADQTDTASNIVANKPTVIDFYADWCGPCRQISPLFEKLESEYGDKLEFRRVNVDENEQEAAKYGITSIPTFIFLDAEGNVVSTVTGADPEALRAEVKKLASN